MSSFLVTTKSRLAVLEGWRGLGALLLILYHFYAFFAPEPFVPWAFLAIDFYFVLIGFIIARAYERPIGGRELSFAQFCTRRAFRLYPVYVLSIALFLLINYFYLENSDIGGQAVYFGMGPELTWQVFAQATMLSNILGMVAPWNGPAWIVSVEWIICLAFFFVTWKLRRVPTLLWVAVIGFCFMYLLDYSPQTLNITRADNAFFNATIARGLMGFSLGALFYRYHHRLPLVSVTQIHALDVTLVVAMLTLIGYYNVNFIISLDYVFMFALFPPLIILSLYKASWIGRAVSLFPFTLLGRISYSVYLLHVPLGYFFQYSPFVQSLNLGKPLYGLVFIAFVIGLSSLTYLFIEVPCRAMGKRLSFRMK